jgi:single stranded DNA-binding protein
MQKISIIGNLGQDLKATPTESGNVLYDISVGCTQGKGDNKTTTWYRCTTNFISEGLKQYLTKGKKVLVHGQLKIGLYTNASGVTNVNANIYIDYIQLVGGEVESHQTAPAQPASQPPPAGKYTPPPLPPPPAEGDKDDLPF